MLVGTSDDLVVRIYGPNLAVLRNKVVVAVDRDKVTRVEIESPKGTVAAAREKDQWTLVTPQPLPADQVEIGAVVSKLRELRALAFLSDDATGIPRYLAKPEYAVGDDRIVDLQPTVDPLRIVVGHVVMRHIGPHLQRIDGGRTRTGRARRQDQRCRRLPCQRRHDRGAPAELAARDVPPHERRRNPGRDGSRRARAKSSGAAQGSGLRRGRCLLRRSRRRVRVDRAGHQLGRGRDVEAE